MKRKSPVPASERMFKLFVEFAPAAIAMFDREMRYIAVSQRFISDYQLINKDIIGHSHYEIFPEISEKWKAIHRSCMAGATEKAEKESIGKSTHGLKNQAKLAGSFCFQK